jgi:hypothetical protein
LSSQLAGRCGEPYLEIGCWRQAERVAVDFRALWPGCRACRGVLDQCEAVRLGWLSAPGAKRSRIVLMIEVWSKTVVDTEPGSVHGETISAGTRTP